MNLKTMKKAIETLKTQLEYRLDDLRINKLMLKDKTNSPEKNLYFKDEIKKNKEIIESIKKAINCLNPTLSKIKKTSKQVAEKEFNGISGLVGTIYEDYAISVTINYLKNNE